MRILLTDRDGQVGSALARTLAPLGELVACGRRELDLLDLRALSTTLLRERPAVIVNAAAYTAVDSAEREPDRALAVNATAVRALAESAKTLGALLIHFSTDFVFDGSKEGTYVETDAPNPLNVYGRSKLAGERAIAGSGCRHYIFRTSWVYSAAGRNFLLAILAAARSKPELRVVNDQHGAPTSSAAIAAAVTGILADASLAQKPSGLYHLCAGGETTWYGFAKAILESKGIATPVVAIGSDEYPAAARRPKNSRLDCRKAAATFGVSLPDWREGLSTVVRALN